MDTNNPQLSNKFEQFVNYPDFCFYLFRAESFKMKLTSCDYMRFVSNSSLDKCEIYFEKMDVRINNYLLHCATCIDQCPLFIFCVKEKETVDYFPVSPCVNRFIVCIISCCPLPRYKERVICQKLVSRLYEFCYCNIPP